MKIMKRLGAIIMMIAMVLSFGVIPAFAETTTEAAPATLAPAALTSTAGSLTIKDANGHTKTSSSYSAYQILTFSASTLNKNIVYTNMKLNVDYKAAIVGAISGLTASSSDNDIFTAISKLDANKTADLAIALKAVTATPKYTTTNGVFKSMDNGYYLVIETANSANDGTVISKPILVAIPNSTTDSCGGTAVVVKTSKPTIEKKIAENGNFYDTNTAAVGDTVNYQSVSTFPTYPSDSKGIEYYVSDTFSAGLTFNAIDKVKVVHADGTSDTELSANTDYKLSTSDSDGSTFHVKLYNKDGTALDTKIKTWGNAGDSLVVTYHATLGPNNVSYGSTGNPNSVRLFYSNKPGVDTTYTPEDTVITYTAKLVVTKTNDKSPNADKLGGATFALSKKVPVSVDDPTGWHVVETLKTIDTDGPTKGTATFGILQRGDYMLVETAAPVGYNLKSDPTYFTFAAANGGTPILNQKIVVTQSGNKVVTDPLTAFKATWSDTIIGSSIAVDSVTGIMNLSIVNTAGFTLPGTGGIGTTIFTVIGIVILLFGGCMALVYTKKKKRSAKH